MIDERDLDAPWEPRTFNVGDRVRVRLSGECKALFPHIVLGRTCRTLGYITHSQEADGKIGIIVPRDLPMSNADHPYYVDFGDGVWTAGGLLKRASYAAIELEPIEEEQS